MLRSVWTWPICVFSFALMMVSVAHSADQPKFDEAALEFFEKEVRPILVTRCYECHSDAKGIAKGGLRVDSRASILKGGDTGPAVTLEKPATSLLLSAVNYGDLYQMPPKSKMPANEIAVLTKWVECGLPWPEESSTSTGSVKPFDLGARAAEHWCWHAVKEVAPPPVKQADWPAKSVDRFILAKLEARGITPAKPADKSTLLRRVYFDLIGLPPSPDEVQEFVQNEDPKALEQVVDRLLGSIHFGERWCRHWLDLTRYGETRGHEFDPLIPNAWQYRDYVIRALNDDVPYDRFLIEHLAGDLVEPRWRSNSNSESSPSLAINESPLGTGFWFLGEEVHSPVDIRKDETDRMDNRLDVLSKTFLGLTVACARCHDHKFDAISQRDYYALAGFAISGCYRQIRVDTFEQHRQIALTLDELRADSRRELAHAINSATRPAIEKVGPYWLAACRAIEAAVTANPTLELSLASEELRQRLGQQAIEHSLDAKHLADWAGELITARHDRSHPLSALMSNVRTSDRPNSASGPSLANLDAETRAGIVVDFADRASTAPLIQDGVSFGLRPVNRGQLVLEGPAETPSLRLATTGGWQRDLFWKEICLSPHTEVDYGTLGSFQSYGRMVRTPEFTLAAHHLWYLVRGSVNVYAAVNSHVVINGPLHGSLLRVYKHNDDQWHWVKQPMDSYVGHRMHVEFSPAEQTACSIAMVVQSDKPPKSDETNETEVATGDQTLDQRIAARQQAFRDALSSLVAAHQGDTSSATTTPENQASAMRQLALGDWIVTHPTLFGAVELDPILRRLRDAEAELKKGVRWDSSLAPAMLESNGVDEYFLVRGNSNTPKDQVSRRFLEVFQNSDQHVSDKQKKESGSEPVALIRTIPGRSDSSSADHHDHRSSGRLELAREILHSPLAPRVAVNRIWHHLFGRGIVPTVDNLGILGLPPSHPELLDHLAAQFVRDGWSIKSMIRSLVLSRTYQMASSPTDADQVDPNNELWHRMPIKRLQGEIIRDSLLAVSGRLNQQAYGPSVSVHLTPFMQGRGRPADSGPLDGEGRRSIYICVRRNFLSPMMLAFDTPNPFSTVGRRTVSNVPSQALILMNDPFVVQQAKLWAERLLADSSLSTEYRLRQMYLTAFSRPPTAEEIAEATRFLQAQTQDRPEEQREAWTNLCHVIFNVKEFVFVD